MRRGCNQMQRQRIVAMTHDITKYKRQIAQHVSDHATADTQAASAAFAHTLPPDVGSEDRARIIAYYVRLHREQITDTREGPAALAPTAMMAKTLSSMESITAALDTIHDHPGWRDMTADDRTVFRHRMMEMHREIGSAISRLMRDSTTIMTGTPVTG